MCSAHTVLDILEEHHRIEQDMIMDHGMCVAQPFLRRPALHTESPVRSIPIPGILPTLCFGEKAIRMFTSFGVDHEEVFVIEPMRILDERHQVLCSRRYRIEEGSECLQAIVPVTELALTA